MTDTTVSFSISTETHNQLAIAANYDRQSLSDWLVATGIKRTKRLAGKRAKVASRELAGKILAKLTGVEAPQTPKEVLTVLVAEGVEVDAPGVYREVDEMHRCGLLVRVKEEGSRARYAVATEGTWFSPEWLASNVKAKRSDAEKFPGLRAQVVETLTANPGITMGGLGKKISADDKAIQKEAQRLGRKLVTEGLAEKRDVAGKRPMYAMVGAMPAVVDAQAVEATPAPVDNA